MKSLFAVIAICLASIAAAQPVSQAGKENATWKPTSALSAGQWLDVNYSGANHVWDSKWLLGEAPGAPRGAQSIDLSATSILPSPGDYLVLIDPTLGEDRAEFTRVLSVQGRLVWIDRALADSFSRIRVVKIPAGRVARNLVIQGWKIDANQGETGIWCQFVDGLTIEKCEVASAKASAIRLDFCRGVKIKDCVARDSLRRSVLGRGFDLYHCRDVNISDCTAIGTRHGFQFSNVREFNLSRLCASSSQDASLDFHGRNSGNGIVSDSTFDGCVKVGNPTFPFGDQNIELMGVRTTSWFQVHGGSSVTMTSCQGKNLILAGYSASAWPKVTAKRCHLILNDSALDALAPQVCVNVVGPFRKCELVMEECEVRSEISGRWTREIFLENMIEGSKVTLRKTSAARIQVEGWNPVTTDKPRRP